MAIKQKYCAAGSNPVKKAKRYPNQPPPRKLRIKHKGLTPREVEMLVLKGKAVG